MIRRAEGNDWIIISQIDHAHLAGALAANWSSDVAPPLPRAEQLVPAVKNHDDGWEPWDRRPRVDPATGRPRNFTEMLMVEATAIWSRSIDRCAQSSVLGGLWVSLHFCWLAERATHEDSSDAKALERFLGEQRDRHQAWRAQAESESAGDELETLVDEGFRFLQLFDSVSLWLCCGELTSPFEAALPDGTTLAFQPIDARRIRVDPFPFSIPEFELGVPGQRISAGWYEDDQQLHEALSDAQHERLGWVIQAVPSDTPN